MTNRGRPTRDRVFEQFSQAMETLATHGGLPPFEQAQPLWDEVWHKDVHHSTAIEGNTLVLREVEVLLEQGRATGAKDLKDYLEVVGYSEAATWIYRQANVRLKTSSTQWVTDNKITLAEIREIHRLAMGKAWDIAAPNAATHAEEPGHFRQHEIQKFSGGMKPPSWPLIPAMLAEWLDRANQTITGIATGEIPAAKAPRLLGDLHAEFERIHPFLDGNGRTGRLILNLVMIRLGWPPVVILTSTRRRYLSALMQADHGDPDALGEIIARAAIASMNTLLPILTRNDSLLPLAALADEKLSLAALRQAIQRGRLTAQLNSEGQWVTSREEIDKYLLHRYHK